MMIETVRFGIAAPDWDPRPAFDELADGVARTSPFSMQTVICADYDALEGALANDECEIAWTAPLVAHALARRHAATPLVAVGRLGATSYYATFAVRSDSGIADVHALAGKRIGWVSKLSASGYVFPRLYLRSLGLDASKLFASEWFGGTHAALAAALARGNIDAMATHATLVHAPKKLVAPHLPADVRLVGEAGPIPGDVIVARASLAAETRRDVARALLALQVDPNGALAKLMNLERFEPIAHNHFALLDRWLGRPASSPPRA